MSEQEVVKSPLRYPGGKSRALTQIRALIPKFTEYREPMVGGGSIFFGIKQDHPNKKYWINDKNKDLYLFWRFCRDNPIDLVKKIRRLRNHYKGRKLYEYLKNPKKKLSEIDRATRFFVLNRITFSGLVDSGGYSKEAHEKRFTDSSIKRIYGASKLLKGVRITNFNYKKLLQDKKRGVFIFLDPPYFSKREAKLYGKKGDLHIKFDHEKFFKNVSTCKCKWLITYDNCAKIRTLFRTKKLDNWQKKKWKLQYGTNNSLNQDEATIGDELFIFDYTPPKK